MDLLTNMPYGPIRGGGGGFDEDALAYIAAVESADDEALEGSVRTAIDIFLKSAKSGGYFDAIKAACLLCGPRTLAGALVPLVGSAPTNVGDAFVSGDYNRLALNSNGTKILNTNRNANADPQDDHHMAIWVATANTGGSIKGYLAAGNTGTGSTQILSNTANLIVARSRSSGGNDAADSAGAVGFIGIARSAAANYERRVNGTTDTLTLESQVPVDQNYALFGRNLTATGDGAISFYSIGEHLNLAALDFAISAYVAAVQGAIE